MRHGFGIVLCASLSFTGCLRLSVDEVGNWKCKSDSECTGGYVCLNESSSTYDPGSRCRPKGWCEGDDQCAENEACLDSACVAAGGQDGLCKFDSDCDDGFACSASCDEFRDESCEPGRCECEPTGAEICNGLDDDCDGEVDEGLGVGDTCRIAGSCNPGTLACVDEQVACTPRGPEREPSDEVCNGEDDDCDGQVDEGLGMTACGLGACQTSVAACVDGKETQCEPKTGSADVCGDSIDNDCDGEVDNDPSQWVTATTESRTDNCSGLMWQREASMSMSNSFAGQYCDTLEADGYDDWRLPSDAEYENLLGSCDGDDFEGVCTPCKDSPICDALFPDEFNMSYYYAAQESYYALYRGTRQGGTSGVSVVRCVRDP